MKTVTVYEYAELSEKAKARARDWFLSNNPLNFDSAIEDAETIAALFGLEIEKTFFSGFCSQGDGASFIGRYKYKKGGLNAVRDYAPLDSDLHAIVSGLQAIQKRHFYKIEMTVTHRGFYYHEFSMNFEMADYYNETAETETADYLRRFAKWIYKQLNEENDYQTSAENVAETIEANQYYFTENGTRFN